jgi:hypothetical protein
MYPPHPFSIAARIFGALFVFSLLLTACDSGGPSEPAVNDVVVIGTRVQPDFRSTGQFDFVAIPLDEKGESILTSGVNVNVETPADLVASVPSREVDDPSGEPLAVALNIDASGSTSRTNPTNAQLAGARTLIRVLDAGHSL